MVRQGGPSNAGFSGGLGPYPSVCCVPPSRRVSVHNSCLKTLTGSLKDRPCAAPPPRRSNQSCTSKGAAFGGCFYIVFRGRPFSCPLPLPRIELPHASLPCTFTTRLSTWWDSGKKNDEVLHCLYGGLNGRSVTSVSKSQNGASRVCCTFFKSPPKTRTHPWCSAQATMMQAHFSVSLIFN